MYEEILKKYWGYDSFRPLQGDIIQSISEGKDTLGLMPTGGGKSLTFQVPTMAHEGLCLVITPLIALMKDQVSNLKSKGIKAQAIYMGMTSKEITRALENCMYGNYKFLYLSPERLATASFLQRLPHIPVSMIAVDESHCISQWGYDFRPSYLKIADIRERLPQVPILALTATATPRVVADIQEKLLFERPNVFQKSFLRSNLAYIVRETEEKLNQLIRILQNIPGSSVVYVRNRKKTREIAEALIANGISATYFHAGLNHETKDKRQKEWKENHTRVIVATNAFGMGIDKPDVRTVVHLDLPDTLEAYFQEVGRAGRDEEKAYAILLYNKQDKSKIQQRTANNYPERDFIRQVYDKLGNYFQIGMGSGLNRTFLFSIGDFCNTFHLPILPTNSAINLLEQAGYLELNEDLNATSRILFIVHKDDLYHIETSALQERIIHTLLRSYTGLFTDPAYVNEEEIAKRLTITRETLYYELTNLARERIISYVPRRQTPQIRYTHERILADQVVIPRSIYEERKQQFDEKIASILHYTEQTQTCRSQILLSYFGEITSAPCQQCDVCLGHKHKDTLTTLSILDRVRQHILIHLKEQSLTTNELADELKSHGHTTQQIADTIRAMLDNKEIAIGKDTRLSLSK